MRAAVFDRFGPPDVLRVADLPDPSPGAGEVLVRVRAAGVQPFDVAVRAGQMPWIDVTFPSGIGQEYAGVVDEVARLAADGALLMPVRAYPLSDVAAAHAAVESRHGRGKVVLIVQP